MKRAPKWSGLSDAAYTKLCEAATHCVLCRKRFSRTRLRALDHRHADGLIRSAAVCAPCNEKLGFLHEDAGWMARAVNYLDNPPAVMVIGRQYVPGSLGAARSHL